MQFVPTTTVIARTRKTAGAIKGGSCSSLQEESSFCWRVFPLRDSPLQSSSLTLAEYTSLTL